MQRWPQRREEEDEIDGTDGDEPVSTVVESTVSNSLGRSTGYQIGGEPSSEGGVEVDGEHTVHRQHAGDEEEGKNPVTQPTKKHGFSANNEDKRCNGTWGSGGYSKTRENLCKIRDAEMAAQGQQEQASTVARLKKEEYQTFFGTDGLEARWEKGQPNEA